MVGRFVGATALLLAIASLPVPLAAAAGGGPSLQFGSRIAVRPGTAAPFLSGDFDGDHKSDAVYLVTVAPASKARTLFRDVAVVDTLFGTPPLAGHGENLALAIILSSGKRKFLIASYGPDGSGYFDSPIWKAAPLPISLAVRGSKAFRGFAKQDGHIRNDVVVLGTEAGIDTALYWDGNKFVLFSPPEEP